MENNLEKRKENRIIYFDHLRVLATFAVVVLHVASVNWYSSDVNGTDWQMFNFYDSIVRWGVPIFLMISGALFLRRDIAISRIYKKYVLRIGVAFIAWSFIYYLLSFGIPSPKNIAEQFLGLFKDGKTQRIVSIIGGQYHLWFLPMIVGIYLCLPIIKKIVEDKRIEKYFLILSFIFGFLIPQVVNLTNDFATDNIKAVVNAINGEIGLMDMRMVLGYAFYFILGYYLSVTDFNKKTRAIIYALGLFGFAFTIIADSAVSIKAQTPTATYYGNFCVNILFEAVAVFTLYKNLSFKNERFNRLIKVMSKLSFGAYLVHVLFIDKLNTVFAINTLSLPVPSYIAVIIISLTVFVLSFLVSAILNCIPVIREYIV